MAQVLTDCGVPEPPEGVAAHGGEAAERRRPVEGLCKPTQTAETPRGCHCPPSTPVEPSCAPAVPSRAGTASPHTQQGSEGLGHKTLALFLAIPMASSTKKLPLKENSDVKTDVILHLKPENISSFTSFCFLLRKCPLLVRLSLTLATVLQTPSGHISYTRAK